MPLIRTSENKYFSAEEGETILAAALREGFILPYSCKTGRCSSCKCKVISGVTVAMTEEFGITNEERIEGWILSCIRVAKTDIQLEVENLEGIKISRARTVPCRIHTLKRVSSNVLKVELRLPQNIGFSYLAGQYIDLIGPEGVRRSYSIANTNIHDGILEIHIREVLGGVMSEYWFGAAKENDLLRLNGPMGTFFLRNVADLDLIFLATGTGIAPIKAMLEQLSSISGTYAPKSISVYWGVREESDLYWSTSLLGADIQFSPVLSRPSSEWRGIRGHVQDAVLNQKPLLKNTIIYACGSDAMIHAARKALVDAGLPENHFYSDAFVCSAKV